MKRITLIIGFLIIFHVAQSHSGRTDSSGGHHDRRNGGYHYHSGGRANRVTQSYSSESNNNDLRIIQEKLNQLGFNCGNPDGVMGANTKKSNY